MIEQIEKGGSAKTTKQGGFMEIGVSVLPKLPRDAGDRNRTSPFAFTGNKFEFRAVGASQSIAGPNTVLNPSSPSRSTSSPPSWRRASRAARTCNEAIQELLPGIIKESKKVIFNGDNYTEEWHKEAEKRGLPNLRNTVDAFAVILRKDEHRRVREVQGLSERELHSRYEILLENYVKTINIEAQLMVMMANARSCRRPSGTRARSPRRSPRPRRPAARPRRPRRRSTRSPS